MTGYELTVNGQVHTQGIFLAQNSNLIFGSANRYLTNPTGTDHIRHRCIDNGEHQFCRGGTLSANKEFLIDKVKALARGNMF